MIIINGQKFHGNSISMSGNKIIIDGKEVTDVSKSHDKEINIIVDGNIDTIDIPEVQTLVVKGNCETLKTMSGNINIEGDVTGNVKTMSGNVTCGNVGGRVKTMSGDVRHK